MESVSIQAPDAFKINVSTRKSWVTKQINKKKQIHSVPNTHLASVGAYGLNPVLRGNPSLALGQYGLLMMIMKY